MPDFYIRIQETPKQELESAMMRRRLAIRKKYVASIEHKLFTDP